MKQIFYIIAVIVLLIIALRLMAKIKNTPEEESNEEPVEK
jgi:hypothetical protein